jgi:hypothetical protein
MDHVDPVEAMRRLVVLWLAIGFGGLALAGVLVLVSMALAWRRR